MITFCIFTLEIYEVRARFIIIIIIIIPNNCLLSIYYFIYA